MFGPSFPLPEVIFRLLHKNPLQVLGALCSLLNGTFELRARDVRDQLARNRRPLLPGDARAHQFNKVGSEQVNEGDRAHRSDSEDAVVLLEATKPTLPAGGHKDGKIRLAKAFRLLRLSNVRPFDSWLPLAFVDDHTGRLAL